MLMASYYLIFLIFVFIIHLHGLFFYQNHRLLPIFISAALAFLAVVSHGLVSNHILLPYPGSAPPSNTVSPYSDRGEAS